MAGEDVTAAVVCNCCWIGGVCGLHNGVGIVLAASQTQQHWSRPLHRPGQYYEALNDRLIEYLFVP